MRLARLSARCAHTWYLTDAGTPSCNKRRIFLFFRASAEGVAAIAAIHLSSSARCTSTAVVGVAEVAAFVAPGGGTVGAEGLIGERVSDAPPDVRDVAGLSMRRNDGRPSLPELLPFADESALTRGREIAGRTSSKSVAITCTVSPSRKPSSWYCLSSRKDLDRSAEKEIFYRRELLLAKDEPETDTDKGGGEATCTCERESTRCEPSVSIEVLPRIEPLDCCRVSMDARLS